MVVTRNILKNKNESLLCLNLIFFSILAQYENQEAKNKIDFFLFIIISKKNK